MATLEEKRAAQKSKIQRNKTICTDYIRLLEAHPGESLYCLLDTLAQRYKTLNKQAGAHVWPQTAPGVRNVLEREGALTK